MRGLAIGEASSTSNPVLQLFARSGGFLTDIYSGSFKIEDIHDASVAASTVVASTPLSSGDKVGTGRYALPTGDTSAWNEGTHRAVVTYVMTSGGPTYTQVIEFEMLDATEWPQSGAFVTYLSSRRAYQDSFISSSVTRSQFHRIAASVSQMIEHWTKRWFEPRYTIVRVSGMADQRLLLDVPIIAIEDIYAVWNTTTGEDTYTYEQYLYKVYNRHLAAFAEVDDRIYPHIELVNVTGTIVRVSGFAWPYGNQNIKAQGVFGYTDPDFDPNSADVLIGHTPMDIARVCGALVYRELEDPTLSDPFSSAPGSIRSYRTRHQAVTFGSSGGSSGGGGGGSGSSEMSGDPLVDVILAKYCRPPAAGAL